MPVSATLSTSSNKADRWLISITLIPDPRNESISSRAFSSTGSGRDAGPELKLKIRPFAIGIINPNCGDFCGCKQIELVVSSPRNSRINGLLFEYSRYLKGDFCIEMTASFSPNESGG